jgi:hypothetical protein
MSDGADKLLRTDKCRADRAIRVACGAPFCAAALDGIVSDLAVGERGNGAALFCTACAKPFLCAGFGAVDLFNGLPFAVFVYVHCGRDIVRGT